ncbi:DUF421 domain-containing protein [Salibacterium halotolerans]|uniref:Uncharacterized membrane protein YcaP, DUF421 family n=1 Tax=Salibacterium halotolerans TaxID=1884432 RepID=A0A1I5RRT2_9BACI|nr:DUF421 domain-containing protein [Salibacterium halotolerans]SFP61225.1 Uncharacterized membrane protein YcaP, DUF421 family [Salibacterium halotolerans]
METITELLTVAGRIITILPLLLLMALFMGKRAIGELPVFDFLIVLTLGSVVGADIADPNIQHIHTAAAVVLIALLQRGVALLKMKNRTIGKYITFKPTVVIQNGTFIRSNLKKIRYSVDNVLEALREKDIFNAADVETAVVEANGSLSVLKKPAKSTVTIEDTPYVKQSSAIAFPVIIEGVIQEPVLRRQNVDESWLLQELETRGVTDINDVFFASLNPENQLHVSLHYADTLSLPPVLH